MPDKKIFTLSSLTKSIENVIKAHCSKVVWIKAEIVKLNYYPKSGHCYPTLVEKNKGKVIAEIRGNIWGGHFEAINNKFKEVLKEELKDNMTVVVKGSVTFHPLHGLALNITDIDPEYTLGELAREKAETVERLKSEHIFDANRHTSLPTLPKTIAIISVETSKGYGDFINVIQNNPWGFKFHFLLFPAILQGERAVNTICEQLEKIRLHEGVFDAIAIIRGGGGEIGLSCFDNYRLAEKIATFPIPVLTGIGHSTNETVSELVSYQTFITPTKIAEFLLQKFHDFAVPLKENTRKLANEAEWMFKAQKTNLKETARLFSSLTSNNLNNSRAQLKQLVFQLENITLQRLEQQHNLLDQTERALFSGFVKPIEESKVALQFTEEKIRLLSPKSILKRGFSITRQNGSVIKNVEQLDQNEFMETQLYSGTVLSHIETTNKENNNE